MIFYDFEVFKYNWLIKALNMDDHTWITIWDDPERLREFYEKTYNSHIYVGFNNKHYDQYIYKGILLGINPKQINDQIIKEGKDGWQISSRFNKIPMINYDVFASKSASLKTLEGFMGSNIKETDVPFDIDRPLTEEEKRQTEIYCESDVENTVKIFTERISTFNSMYAIISKFPDQCNISNISDTGAQITSRVLGCNKKNFKDEFDFFILSCIRLKKYKEVQKWFEQFIGLKFSSEREKAALYKSESLTLNVAGILHTFGFGGCHGAPNDPVHYSGGLYHIDVNNYYPSLLLAHGIVTRAATNNNFKTIYDTRKALKYKQTHAKTKEEVKKYKKEQLPYKLMLNALSGAMKDHKNNAYDPRNNNIMCINGQLMLLDLIEHLEEIPNFKLIQSNTDGLIIQIPDTNEAFDMMDDICYEWECRMSTDKCEITLETDQIAEIYQKDVNNYLWIDLDGGIERKGGYVKELNSLDYDLPIINKALVEYMVNKIPVAQTINDCQDLIMFQKIVKLSSKYEYVEHNGIRYEYKCYRVFASDDLHDGQIHKCRSGSNPAKFGNTPDHCFIDNNDIQDKEVPDKLDRQWYIDLAEKRLKDFGIRK